VRNLECGPQVVPANPPGRSATCQRWMTVIPVWRVVLAIAARSLNRRKRHHPHFAPLRRRPHVADPAAGQVAAEEHLTLPQFAQPLANERRAPQARLAQENTRDASFKLSSFCCATTRSRSTAIIRPLSTTTRPLMTV